MKQLVKVMIIDMLENTSQNWWTVVPQLSLLIDIGNTRVQKLPHKCSQQVLVDLDYAYK